MLMPHLRNFTFDGIVKIMAEVERTTNTVTLNVGKIRIKELTVTRGKINLYQLYTLYNNVTEKYTIVLNETLKTGSAILIAITYDGVLGDNLIGFYRSSYFDERGQLK